MGIEDTANKKLQGAHLSMGYPHFVKKIFSITDPLEVVKCCNNSGPNQSNHEK